MRQTLVNVRARRRRLVSVAALAATQAVAPFAWLAPKTAEAASLYWDLNGATANTAVAITGAWNGTNAFWNTVSSGTGGTPQALVSSADDLFFSSGTTYTAGTVTLSTNVAANSITFEENIAATLTTTTSNTITLGGGVATPGIFVLSGNNAANSVSPALILGAASTIQTAGTGVLTISGGITGTANLILRNNSTGAGGVTVSGGINNVGTLTSSGTGTGTTIISGAIGSNVTSINQTGTSALTISSALTLASASMGTFTTTGSGALNLTGGISGTQALVFNANSTGAINVTTNAIGTTGTITNSGTGIGVTTLSANIGNTVTDVTQNSATSQLILTGTNAYSGNAIATSGLLGFTNVASIPNFATLTAGKLQVASGGIIGFGYGGAGRFTTTDIDGILNGTKPVTFAATGTRIGLDTSSASISYTNVIANPTGTTSFGLVKYGTNTLTVGAANTFTGPVSVYNGVLSASSIGNVGATSGSLGAPTTVAEGTIALGFTTTTGTLQYTGTGETTDRVIDLAGTTGGAGIEQAGTGLLRFTSNLTFTGTGGKTLTLSGSTAGTGEISGTIGGVFNTTNVATVNPFVINKTGTGTWTLSGTGNTATTLQISNGVLNTGPNGLTLGNVGAATIQGNGVTGGTAAIVGTINLVNTGAANNGADVGATAAGFTLDLSGAVITGGAAANIDFFSNGTTILGNANTYAGQTRISGTTLQVSSLGTISGAAPSSFGQPSGTGANGLSNSTIISVSGVLRYVGTGETTDRVIDLQGTTTATTLDQSGTGLLKFTANHTASGAGIKVMTLQGSTAGTGELSGNVIDNSATNTTGITKTGTGTWTLSGINATTGYTGPTTVNGGNLAIAASGALANTPITINATGVLSPASGVSAGNTATAAKGASLTLNPLGVLNLSDGTVGNFTLVQNATFAGPALTLNGGTIAFDLGTTAGSADSLVLSLNGVPGTGVAAMAGGTGIVINPTGAVATGNYTLVQAGSGLSNANFYLATPNLNVGGTLYNLSLSLVGTNEVLTIATGGPAATPGSAFWTGGVNGSWAAQPGGAGTATNFNAAASGTTNTLALPGIGTNVVISADTATNLTTTLDQNFQINALILSGAGTANSAGSTIASGVGTNSLRIDAAAVNGNIAGNGIFVLAGSGANTISANVVLGASQAWTSNSLNATTVSGVISEASAGLGITIAGTGQFVLSNAANTYSGATVVNGGVLTVATLANGGAPSSIGQSSNAATNLVLGATTFRYTGPSVTIDRNATLTTGATSVVEVTTAGTTLSMPGFTGTSNTGALTKAGPGTLVLSGASSYTGATIVREGTLTLSGPRTAASGGITVSDTAGLSATLNISNGTFALGGNQFNVGNAPTTAAVGTVNQTGGAISFTSGNALLIGQNTVANQGIYNLSGGSITTFASTTRGIMLGVNTGALGGTFNLSGTGVINMTAASGGGGDGFLQIGRSDAAANNTTNAFNQTGGTANVGIVAIGGNGANGSGVTSTLNLTGGVFSANQFTRLAQGNNNTANIIIGGTADVTLPAFPTARGTSSTATITFDGGVLRPLAASATYMGGLTNAFITNNGATLEVPSGRNITVTQVLSNATAQSGVLNKTGVGVLTLGGANTYGGGTNINAGTVAAGIASALPGGGAVNVNSGTLDVATFNNSVGAVTLQSGGSIAGTTGVLTATAFDFRSGTSSAILDGAVGITKTTAGTVTLSGANNSTFSGPVSVSAGTLAFSTSGHLGNASVTNVVDVNGGTLSFAGTGSVDLGVNRVLTVGSSGATVQVPAVAGTLTVSGGIAGASTGNLTKTGPGTLVVGGTTSLNAGAGSVNVAEGTLRASFGTGGVSGLTVGTFSSLQFVNNAAATLTLGTAGTLNLANFSRLGFEIGAPGTSDQVVVPTLGTATATGTVTLDFFSLGGIAAGTYPLLSAPGGLNGATYVLGNVPGGTGLNYSIVQSATAVSLVTSTTVPIYWKGGTDSVWTTPGANWNDAPTGLGTDVAAPTAAQTVVFSAANAPLASGTITTTLEGNFTIDGLQFEAAPVGVTSVTINPGTVTPGTLTLAPAASSAGITVAANAGAAVINAPVVVSTAQTWNVDGTGVNGSALALAGVTAFNAAVTKTGAGAVTLSGVNTGTGGFTLLAGTLNINSATATGAGPLTISGGTLDNKSVGPITLTNNNAQNWLGDFAFAGTQALNMGTGAVTLVNNVAITTAASTLSVGGVISESGGSRALTKSGAGALTLGGANTFTGGVVLNAGTLNIGNASALGTGAFTINGGTINNTSAAALTLAPNPLQNWNGSFTFTGTDSLNLGTGAVTLGASPTVTVNANTLTVGGGISGAFGLTKAGAGALTLTGLSATAANNYSGATTLEGGTTNISSGTTAALTGTLNLGATATSTAVNTLNLTGSASFSGMTAQTVNTTASVINVGTGTLSTNGAVTIGVNGTAPATLNLTVSGAGAWNVIAPGATFRVGGNNGGAAANSSTHTLDMNGTVPLATFVANLGAGGFFRMAGTETANNPTDSHTVRLATNSTIIAGTLDIGGSSSHAGSATLRLGGGLATLNANTINIGSATTGTTPLRMGGTLNFADATLGSVIIRAADGVGAATINVLNSSANTNSTLNGSLLLAGHNADVLAGTVTLADRRPTGTTTTANCSGTLSFSAGTFTATTLVMANRGGSTVTTSTTTATATLSGGTATIGTVTMSQNSATTATSTGASISTLNLSGTVGITTLNMGNNTVATAGNTSGTTATLNVSGGATTVGTLNMAVNAGNANLTNATTAQSTINLSAGALNVTGNVSMGNTTNNALNAVNNAISITGGVMTVGGDVNFTNGVGVETVGVTLNGGTLDMTAGNLGTAATVIPLAAQAGTLQNLGQLNGGGALTKTTAGTLVMSGASTYTGTTNINAGVLNVGSAETAGVSGPLGNQLATAAGTIVFGGGTLQYSAANQFDYSGRFSTAAAQPIAIDTNGQTVTFATALVSAGGTLAKSGAGTLNLTGANTYTGSTTVTGGALVATTTLESSVAPMSVTGAGSSLTALRVAPSSLTIGAGASAKLTNIDYVGSFAGRSTAGTLANTGLLDVNTTGIVIATAVEADVRAQIIAGRNSGTWNGTTGITSSAAAADTTNRAVGYFVNGTEITVAQTIPGDSNLDGIVNVLDRGTYLANVGQSPRNWQQADWNYDDIVNVLDRAIYLGHVGMSLPTPPPFGAGSGSAGDALGAMSGSGSGTPMLDGPVGGNTTPGDGVPAVTYDPTTGKLMLDTDGLSNINAIFLPVSPQSRFVTVVGDIDGAAGANWSQFYAGGQNWESALFTPAGNLTMGTWELATMQTGLSTSVFSGGIQFILQNGNLVNTTVEVVPEPTGLALAAMAGLGLLARRRRK